MTNLHRRRPEDLAEQLEAEDLECIPCIHYKGLAWGEVICARGKKWPKYGHCKFMIHHPARAARKAGL